jgi:hypothetical protein
VKVEAEIVDAVIASLNVAVTLEAMATPMVPFVGVTAVTVGATGGGGGGVLELPPHPAMTRVAATRHQAE